MNFTAEYQATFEEFKQASLIIQKRFNRRVFKRARIVRITSGLLVFTGVGVLTFLFLQQNSSTTGLTVWPWFLIVFGILPIVIFAQYRMRRSNLSKMWEKAPVWHQKRCLHIDDDGLTVALRTCTYRTVWQHYIRFEETPKLFLLFATEHSAEFIPKRIFTDPADIDAFRELLRHNIGPATKAFPVIPIAAEDSSSQST